MDQAIPVSLPIENFLKVVESEAIRLKSLPKTSAFGAGKEADQIAFWYEKIRMAIDYREEHLLRRTASRRILKRIFILEGRKKEVADLLLRELMMGGYVKKSDLTEEKFVRINQALNKYTYALSSTYRENFWKDSDKGSEIRRWLITLASFEVEEILYPFYERRALIDGMYQLIASRVDTGVFAIPEKKKNLQTYIAIYRSLARADRAMVTSEIFRIYFPDWFTNPSQKRVAEIMKNATKIIPIVKSQATDILSSRIFYAVKRQTLYAHIFYEVIMENPEDARGVVAQEYILREFVKKKMEEEYERSQNKLRKRIQRGIIYIFLTKMLLALFIEIPFEKYFGEGINFLALGINILFPPAFMVFLALSAKIPGEENTEAIVQGIKRLVYNDPAKDEIEKISVYPLAQAGLSEKTLDALYFIIFSLVFGVLIWLLYFFNFDYVSGAIFLIFMATVSFFGALIRQSIRDLIVIKEKEGMGSLLFDTLLLPFVRFGRWLSTNFSKINVFMFLLDVVIEAPFKLIIRLFESWVGFLKRKREEVDQQFG
jgi:hypothetical protein